MTITSSGDLLNALGQFHLLEPGQLAELRAGALADDPRAAAGHLIQRGWLTPYQANRLLRGQGQDLLLGSYVLQERLGQGAMGEVFKGRNWKLGQVVAIKLIHKAHLANADVARRFHREIRAAAQLNHVNIVRALDADEVGGTLLLVMEYVEGGIDLYQLVKQAGPLAVDRACDYVRQAALGLQHAWECDVIHRDIKPANLLLTAQRDIVKILDMGLARLLGGGQEGLSTMTREGVVMGTPDYLAPEQAEDARLADIRSDLYSLGCSFYFLLAGRAPFRGKTTVATLLKHRMEEAAPIEQLRSEVPPAVGAVVRRLLAKRPEERYQTPAELAAALAPLPDQAIPVSATVGAGITAAQVQGASDPESGWSALELPTTRNALPRLTRLDAEAHRWRGVVLAGGLLLLVGVVLLVFFALPRPAEPPLKSSPQAVPEPKLPEPPPKKTAVVLHWNMADDADIYLNGKPLRDYRPDFRTRHDEAWQQYQAQAVLTPGDVFTVGGRRGGSYGLWLVALDAENRVVWRTDTQNWKVYQPDAPASWHLPEVALRSPAVAVSTNPQPWHIQTKMSQRFGHAQSIWASPQNRTTYLYSVVR